MPEISPSLKRTSRIKKKVRLGQFPSTNVIVTMTFALMMLGAFGLLVVHARMLEGVIKNQLEVQLFLKKNLPQNQIDQVRQVIASKPFILKKDGKPQIGFISKEEAAEKFIAETGEDFTQFLGENPLRDSYSIRIKEENLESDNLLRIKKQLEEIPGIFEVSYTEDLIDNVDTNIQKAGIVLSGIFLIMLISSIMLINNSIKLALFSQRFLIRSMQLVGAKPLFIQRPYITRGTIQGLISGLIACIVLSLLLHSAYDRIKDLRMLHDARMVGIVYGSLIIIGILVGLISSMRSVRKYLKLSLDELY